MKLNHLNNFNENFLSIDINLVKNKAFEFHKTSECRKILSKIDSSLLENASQEIKNLSDKYKSIDIAIKKIISKFQSNNEGIIGMSILTIFGLHAFIKLLIKFKDNKSILQYIGSLFRADSDRGDGIKTLSHAILTIIFIMYLFIFIIRSNSWFSDSYKSKLYTTGISWQWSGPNNYIIKDSFNKKYLFKKSGDEYKIYHNDTLIGSYINDNLVDSKGKIVLEHIDDNDLYLKYSSLPNIEIDLEKLLTGKYKLNIKNGNYILI